MTKPNKRTASNEKPSPAVWQKFPFATGNSETVLPDPVATQSFRNLFPDWNPAEPNWEILGDVILSQFPTADLAKLSVENIRQKLCVKSLTISRAICTATSELRTILPMSNADPLPKSDSDIDRQMARQRGKIRWLSEAMTMISQRPDLSNAAIARAVGKDPGTLSRNVFYQRAAKAARESPAPPQGRKISGQIEAVSETRDDSENE
jgi:hypothetical protein